MYRFHHYPICGPGGTAVPIILGLAFYVYLAICLQVLAKKTGTEHAWMAWVPVLNLYLLCKIAGKPGWWIVFTPIPFVNVFFGILVFMAIAQMRGKPYWWGILIAIPLVRFIVPGYLAFSGQERLTEAAAAG
jgi:hypothetical protein